MSHPFDATLKSLIADHPADFAAVFDLPAHEPVTTINVDLDTISAATDVALMYGNPAHTIVDLNFQTGPDPDLPGRLHLYSAAIHHHHHSVVRSILVLLRSKADAANLTGRLVYGNERSGVEFRYEVIRLWQQPVDHYLHAGIAVLPLATLCELPSGQSLAHGLRDVVLEIQKRLGQEASHAEAVRLMTAAYILTGLRVKKSDLASIYRGVGLMTESTAYDEAVEEGELKNSHKLLLRIGRKQFGEADAASEAELKSIRDLERLERLADAILTAKSWQELLATP